MNTYEKPQSPKAPKPQSPKAPKPQSPSVPLADKKSILVIDDEKPVRESVNILFYEDYKMFLCKNVKQAYKILAKHKIDLIILDYILPETDGITFLKHLKGIPAYAELPVIFLTGVACTEIMKTIFFYNNVCCIEKPFNIYELVITARWKLGDMPLDMKAIEENKAKDTEHAIVTGACRFIRENYTNPALTPGLIAESAGINIAKLNATFKKRLGHTPMDQLDVCRIKKAMDILRLLKLGMAVVARQTGITNLKTFYNIFKKYTRLTPKKYKKAVLSIK